tara:strand:- start:2160 stop:2456 length:297 start_codon:yes stop_codon:yes gene_type:complete
MNFLVALVVAVMSWITFTTLNELASAKGGEGCCKTKDCGTSFFDTVFWWTNLSVAIVFTIYVLMLVYDEYGGTVKSKAASMMRKNPVTKGVEMVFGYR